MGYYPQGHETPCLSETALHHQKSHKGWTWICTQLYRILTHAIKLPLLPHLPMLYQHTLSVLKSKYIFTIISRKSIIKIISVLEKGKIGNGIQT